MRAAQPILIPLAAVAAAALVLMVTARTPGPVGSRRVRASGQRPIVLDQSVACELLSVLFAGGASIPDALATLGEATGDAELTVAARLLRWGAGWEEATEQLPRHWSRVVGPLQAAWVHGVDPAPVLRTTAATWRARRAARAREAAERLSVRLVLPLGLCLLPAFILLGLVPVALSAGAELLGGS